MDYKDIIILILFILVIYYNLNNIFKLYKNVKNKLFQKQHYEVKSDMSLIKKEQVVIQSYIKKNIDENVKDKKLKEILLYSLGDGKRVRPIIIISTYKKLTNSSTIPNYVINAALAIEYIHCASLVIDDIMDDDDERRDKPSVHIKYGLTMAQLSTVILCSLAMQNLFGCLSELNKTYQDTNKNIPLILGSLISELIKELSIGQYLDVTMPSNFNELGGAINHSVKMGKLKMNVEELIHKKTSSLFEFCFIMSWVLANYNKSDSEIDEGVKNMKNLARHFGLIFQISDDFEDVEKDSNKNGKNAVMNYVIYKGYYGAYKDYHKIVNRFNDLCSKEDMLTDEIKQMITYLSVKVNVYYKNDKDKFIF
jgi:geranylgeranyl diphosphate synthase, type II